MIQVHLISSHWACYERGTRKTRAMYAKKDSSRVVQGEIVSPSHIIRKVKSCTYLASSSLPRDGRLRAARSRSLSSTRFAKELSSWHLNIVTFISEQVLHNDASQNYGRKFLIGTFSSTGETSWTHRLYKLMARSRSVIWNGHEVRLGLMTYFLRLILDCPSSR